MQLFIFIFVKIRLHFSTFVVSTLGCDLFIPEFQNKDDVWSQALCHFLS